MSKIYLRHHNKLPAHFRTAVSVSPDFVHNLKMRGSFTPLSNTKFSTYSFHHYHSNMYCTNVPLKCVLKEHVRNIYVGQSYTTNWL